MVKKTKPGNGGKRPSGPSSSPPSSSSNTARKAPRIINQTGGKPQPIKVKTTTTEFDKNGKPIDVTSTVQTSKPKTPSAPAPRKNSTKGGRGSQGPSSSTRKAGSSGRGNGGRGPNQGGRGAPAKDAKAGAPTKDAKAAAPTKSGAKRSPSVSEHSKGSRPSGLDKLNIPSSGSDHSKKVPETKQKPDNSSNKNNNKTKGKPDDKDIESVGSTRFSLFGSGKKTDKDEKSAKSKGTTESTSSTHLSKSMDTDDDELPLDEEGEDSLVYKPPSKTLLIIWSVVGAELILDLVTTIIAFKSLMSDGECCGEKIELGGLPLGITIPFFLLIVLELACLLYVIKLTLFKSNEDHAAEEEALQAKANADTNTNETNNNNAVTTGGLRWEQSPATGGWMSPLTGGGGVNLGELGTMPGTPRHSAFWFRIINWLVMLNPFFGFMVAWMLLYQSDKVDSFTVLGLEAASLLLHWGSIYLEGQKQTWCSLAIHMIPAIPFGVTVIVILVYLNEGGVCYLVDKEVFWYEGCAVCPDGSIPDAEGICLSGLESFRGDYCGDTSPDGHFCFFGY
jgi:hypothetical protein